MQNHYERSRWLLQAHIWVIVEAPAVKDSSSKQLPCHHNVCGQHLRGLKAIKHDLSGVFVTPLIKMKLDQMIMFEWQRYSQHQSNGHH